MMRGFEDPQKRSEQLRALGNARVQLLAFLPWFVQRASRISGVQRLALLGSITTEKKNPKDIDFLVQVADDANLAPLAKLGRQLQGRAQQFNHGADIFLTNPQGVYIGRTCHWVECRPGKRLSCDALNCGKREYLHDDFKTVNLSQEALTGALELWPKVEERVGLPADLLQVIRQLKQVSAG
jgi:hypothetical protein